MADETSPRRPWNPVAWLVLGIPLATIAAGLWTLRIASGENALDATPDPVLRTAQVQVAPLDADLAAAREGLGAQLSLDADGAVVRIHGPAGPLAPVLQLVHPVDTAQDRVLDLRPDPAGWRADAPVAADHAWHVRLLAADGRWRLVGRYRPGDADVVLAPAVAAP